MMTWANCWCGFSVELSRPPFHVYDKGLWFDPGLQQSTVIESILPLFTTCTA